MTGRWPNREPLTAVGPLHPEPGTLARGTLTAGMAAMPLLACAGTRPGPVVYVQALQHGLELNGCDVMRHLVQNLDPGALAGTLILVPMANPLAARVHMQSFPYPDRPTERRLNDMNRRWFAGHESTNAVDLQVEALMPIVALADACIDLHCHEYLYSTMALTDMDSPTCADLALAMGFEVIHGGKDAEGMFGGYVRGALGRTAVTVEMPPLRRVHPVNSAAGYRGVVNALRRLGMLEGDLELPGSTAIFGGGRSASVGAECEGFMARYAAAGAQVHAGQCVAEIWSPDDFSVVQRIEAPFDGCLTAVGRPPQMWGDPEQDFIHVGERAASFAVPARVVDPRQALAQGGRQ